MPRNQTVLFIILVMTWPANARAQIPFLCGNVFPSGEINLHCSTLDDAIETMPCGVSNRDNCRFFSDEEGCLGALGQEGTSSWTSVSWTGEPGTGCVTFPPEWRCTSLGNSITTCDPGEPEWNDDCPDPGLSGFIPPQQMPDPSGWMPSCRLVVLMEHGWRTDPRKVALGGVFGVGALVPSQDAGYRNLAALGPMDSTATVAETDSVLVPMGRSKRWGAQTGSVESWGAVEPDWRELRRVGISVNPNALAYSPYWTELEKRYRRGSALVTRGGTAADPSGRNLDLYFNNYSSEEKWRQSGASFADLWPRLQKIERYDVVCADVETGLQRLRSLERLFDMSNERE